MGRQAPSSSNAASKRGATRDFTRLPRAESIAYCERLFSEDLRGNTLMSNQSKWISFPTLKTKTWIDSGSDVVSTALLGDSAHTAHFSIGSGTKLAMEDAIALVNAFENRDAATGDPASLKSALADYQMERKPIVRALSRSGSSITELLRVDESLPGSGARTVRVPSPDAQRANGLREPQTARSILDRACRSQILDTHRWQRADSGRASTGARSLRSRCCQAEQQSRAVTRIRRLFGRRSPSGPRPRGTRVGTRRLGRDWYSPTRSQFRRMAG